MNPNNRHVAQIYEAELEDAVRCLKSFELNSGREPSAIERFTDEAWAELHIAALISAAPTPWLPEWLSFEDAAAPLLRAEPSIRIVQGPPGCGKTRLIAQLALERQRRVASLFSGSLMWDSLWDEPIRRPLASGLPDQTSP